MKYLLILFVSIIMVACTNPKESASKSTDSVSEEAESGFDLDSVAKMQVEIWADEDHNSLYSGQEEAEQSYDANANPGSKGRVVPENTTKTTAAYNEGYDAGYEDGCNRERNESFAPKSRINPYYSDYCEGYAEGYHDGYMDTIEDYAIDGTEEDDDDEWEEE